MNEFYAPNNDKSHVPILDGFLCTNQTTPTCHPGNVSSVTLITDIWDGNKNLHSNILGFSVSKDLTYIDNRN